MRHPSVLLISLLLAGLGSASLQAAVPVRAATIDGRSMTGLWQGIDTTGHIVLSMQGKPTPLAMTDLMSVHCVGAESRPAAASRPAESVMVWLSDGSRFGARITGGGSDHIEFETGVAPQLRLKLTRLAAIRFSSQEIPSAAKGFTEALAHRDTTQDTLFVLQDGRVSALRGVLESLDARGGTFKWRERSIHVDRSRAFGVVLATGAGEPIFPTLRCTFSDGSMWSGKIIGATPEALQLELAAGPTVQVQLSQLADLRFRNDRVTFLSDLEPSDYQFKSWGTTRWPYHKDLSAANRPLSIGGEPFDRGIGMHSQSVLTYKLAQPYKQFAAVIGLDDAVGSRGSVVFRVIADGRELFNSGTVTGKDAPRPVLAALNGAKTLQLRVDFGEDLDIGDQADWGAARLIK